MGYKRCIEERMYKAGRHERTYEERTEQGTRSGRIYNRRENWLRVNGYSTRVLYSAVYRRGRGDQQWELKAKFFEVLK